MIKNLLTDVLGRRKDNFDWRSAQPPLDLANVKNVCILHHNDKFGDAILISLLVDALAKARPGLEIYVGSPGSFVNYWSQHPAVTQAIEFDIRRGIYPLRTVQGWWAGRAWRQRFEVVVSFHPFSRPEQFALLRSLKPRVAIGFNKDPYRLFDYSLEEHRHGVDLSMIATRSRSVMKIFGHETAIKDLRAHLPSDPHDEARLRETLTSLASKDFKVLVNVYGAGKEKRLTPSSVRRIVEELRRSGHVGPVVVSVPSGVEAEYRTELAGIEVAGPQGGLSTLCALVAAVDLVISPDTAVGHIAAVLQKPQVCLFARRGSVPTIWKPLNDRCVCLVPRAGNDVNGIDWAEFALALRAALATAGAPPAIADRPAPVLLGRAQKLSAISTESGRG